MPIIKPEALFIVYMVTLCSPFIVLPLVLLMHFLMPKLVLERYFKPPFFREIECKLFSGIPYAPMRTVMFMGVIAFPSWGKKRRLTRVYQMVPESYRIASKIFVYYVFLFFISITLLTALILLQD